MAGALTMAVIVKQLMRGQTTTTQSMVDSYRCFFCISVSLQGCTIVSPFTEAEGALGAMVEAHPIAVAKTRTR